MAQYIAFRTRKKNCADNGERGGEEKRRGRSRKGRKWKREETYNMRKRNKRKIRLKYEKKEMGEEKEYKKRRERGNDDEGGGGRKAE
jgi:hypothetical protein